MKQNFQIISAGGILTRVQNGQIEIALVKTFRRKVWSLPKGKPKPCDKSFLETAVREVEEETGCLVTPNAYAGDYFYKKAEGNKLVLIWLMEVVKENQRPLFEDILEIRWLRPLEAVSKLARKCERKFLAQILKDTGLETLEKKRLTIKRSDALKRISEFELVTD